MRILPDHVPVAVIGAGPTGLSVACLLAQAGVPVLVLERAAAPLDLPRAIVLDDEGLRMLQALDLSDAARAATQPANGARYYDRDRQPFAEVGVGPEPYGFPKRNYLFQPDLEALLLARVQAEPLAHVLFGHEVTDRVQDDDGVTLAIATPDGGRTQIRCDWLVACDGGRSPTRTALGIPLDGETYGQDWVVIDMIRDLDDEPVSRFFCDDRRPHVSICAPRGGRRYEFMVMPGENGQDLLTDAALERLLAPIRAFDPADLKRRAIYTFHARMARNWQAGRIFLAGDAAHLTPPFAGQGMNAGLRDAHNLAWKIAAVVRGGAAPAILDSYEAERRAPAWAMIQLAVAMGRVVMPAGPADAQLRDIVVTALAPFPAARDWLLQMKFKPRPRYARGLFLDLDSPPFDGALVGEMVPQPPVEGQPLDDLLGPGFALLAQDAPGAAALPGLCAALAPLAPRAVALPPGVLDPADARARSLRVHRDQVLLIRPDRYAMAAFDPAKAAADAARLRASLGA